nr:EOG090X0DUK [Eulimnadia texana]
MGFFKCRQILTLFYSKGKDKAKGGDKKTKKVAVQINEEELAEVINADALKRDLQHAIDRLKDDYIKHVSLRSSAGTLENLTVEVDGDKYTLQELGQIGRKGPQTVVINLASFPQVIPNVLKAIQDSGMGLNPQQDGTTLFITIPKVTKEHRENLAKNAKTLMNKCKDHLRDVHNRYSKDAKKKEKDISADLLFSVQQQIQLLTEQHVHEAEKLLAAKQQELLGS